MFALNADLDLSFDPLLRKVMPRADQDRVMNIDATRIAQIMLGNAVGANLFLIGYAWQKGLVPLRADSIERAIELNGTEVAMNKRAFGLGRIAATRPDLVAVWLRGHEEVHIPDTLGDLLADRMPRLRDWAGPGRGDRWVRRYRALVARVEAAEAAIPGADGKLARAVALVAAKLMTYKDEYEVARLMTAPAFAQKLRANFSGDFKTAYNLAPPLFSKRDKRTGRPAKRRFGAAMGSGFALLARLTALRGTPLDPFGYGAHRRMERRLIADYTTLVSEVLATVAPHNIVQAEALLRAHNAVRGYDVVKEASLERVRAALPDLWTAFRTAPQGVEHAADKAGVHETA